MRGIIVYDSQTGNTEKVAKVFSQTTGFELTKVASAPTDLRGYDILVLGTLNIRGNATPKVQSYLQKAMLPSRVVVLITFGMPFWGPVSSWMCFSKLKKTSMFKGAKSFSCFMCPGYHIKYKTYSNRPSEQDFSRARKFAQNLINRVK